jgi:hypothetical protein
MVNYDCDTGKFNINHVHYYNYKQTLKQRILGNFFFPITEKKISGTFTNYNRCQLDNVKEILLPIAY